MGETTAVAHGGNQGSRSWGGPPLAALPPQDRAASPRPRCIALIAVSYRLFGAFSFSNSVSLSNL
ncbi:MAG: hypothetical protein F6K65_40020 [Moorea sp. SIO3C2]|nr:hypothetical protein [Moorena sp. SIO3C2]